MRLERIAWTRGERPVEATLEAQLAREGYEVFGWSDAPGASYTAHSHDHDESLWVVDGEITFGVANDELTLGPGDRLMLPKGTVHTARAGGSGARYLIGQRPE